MRYLIAFNDDELALIGPALRERAQRLYDAGEHAECADTDALIDRIDDKIARQHQAGPVRGAQTIGEARWESEPYGDVPHRVDEVRLGDA